MNGKTIERLDKQRYYAVLLETVGLLFIFIGSLISYIEHAANPKIIISAPEATGLLLLIVGGAWYGVIWWKTRRNPELAQALYNEMHRQYKYQNQRLALWVIVAAGLVSMFAIDSRFTHVIVTEIIILLGVLTMKISWLILNRG